MGWLGWTRLWPLLVISVMLALVGGTLLPTGCTQSFVAAVGPNDDAALFTDFPVGDARNDAVRRLLSTPVMTPLRPEAPFAVERADSNAFRSQRGFRNLILLGDMTSNRWCARQARSLIGEDRLRELRAKPAGHVFGQDVWADGQTVLFVHATSAAALDAFLEAEGDAIMRRFEYLVIEGLTKTLYLSGEQAQLADGIRQRHGYSLRIPKDFLVDEQADNRFVKLKRILPGEPVMFFFIYYQEQTHEELSADLCMTIRDTLGAIYYTGDRIARSRTEVRKRRFLGREALEIYGLYQNDSPPMGGPFKLLCFHDGGRLYLIDLAVFNPPGNKTPQLRILEAIARSFQPVAPG